MLHMAHTCLPLCSTNVECTRVAYTKYAASTMYGPGGGRNTQGWPTLGTLLAQCMARVVVGTHKGGLH